MNLQSFSYLGLIIAALSTTACSAIRVVEVSRDGGEIALLGDRDGAMEKAQREMALTCGGPNSYEVVRQGEVVVGEVTMVRQRSRRLGRRGRITRQQAVTQARREWRVYYECVGEQDVTGSAGMHHVTVTF